MKKFYFTHGRGLFEFAKKELDYLIESSNNEYSYREREYIEGKLCFETDLKLESLLKLTLIERLFLELIFEKFENKEISERGILKLIDDNLNVDTSNEIFLYILDTFNHQLKEEEEKSKKLRKSIKFRIDCKLTGNWRSNLNFKSQLIDLITKKISTFEADLINPDIIVSCHLSEVSLAIGIPITKSTLSLRESIKHVGLRSTICSAMIQLSELLNKKSYSLILDPFCGKSTILCELIFQYKGSNSLYYVSSDADNLQIGLSIDNLNSLSLSKNIHHDFINTNLLINSIFPFKDKLFDLILTDLPFGKNHPIKFFDSQETFFHKILNEFNRLLKNGFCVLLINSKEMKIFEKVLESNRHLFKMESKFLVSLGETSAYLIKLSQS